MEESTERFTKTVQDYVKYRPSYPKTVLAALRKEAGLTRDIVIADVGSGTGLLCKLFLDNHNVVFGVEPNHAMREAGEEYLKSYKNFHSVVGTAEATTLEDQSISMIAVGTAFHWFDADKAKKEFLRILKPGGWVVLLWNVRDTEHSPLLQEYEELILKYGTHYAKSAAQRFDKAATENFFSPYEMKVKSFKNTQQFDWEGLQGRLLSTSYALRPGDPSFEDMIRALKVLFEHYQKNGKVEFLYQTKMYYGRLK